jgi:hypothetical protein
MWLLVKPVSIFPISQKKLTNLYAGSDRYYWPFLKSRTKEEAQIVSIF